VEPRSHSNPYPIYLSEPRITTHVELKAIEFTEPRNQLRTEHTPAPITYTHETPAEPRLNTITRAWIPEHKCEARTIKQKGRRLRPVPEKHRFSLTNVAMIPCIVGKISTMEHWRPSPSQLRIKANAELHMMVLVDPQTQILTDIRRIINAPQSISHIRDSVDFDNAPLDMSTRGAPAA
jgi:hypothetical protein